MDNIEAQTEEIIALQSIFEEKEFLIEGMNPICGRYIAEVLLPNPFYVVSKRGLGTNGAESENSKESTVDEHLQLEHLPPINLFFEFPSTYPSDTCPAFLLSCNWLTLDQITLLCKQLENLWVESFNEVILFRWIQFLKEEVLGFLNITDTLDVTELTKYSVRSAFTCQSVSCNKTNGKNMCSDESKMNVNNQMDGDYVVGKKCSGFQNIQPSVHGGSGSIDNRAILDLHDGKVLKARLKDFEAFKKMEVFQNSWQFCNICFADKKGSDCTVFKSCNHFFCNECIKSYFEVQIKEGNIYSLNCLEGKCSSQADGTMVKKIVSSELFERYDSLLLSRTLENMSDIAYCPRQKCQCPLLLDTCGRMGACPACKFVFCSFCKMAYHGVAPCNFKSGQKRQIFDEYMNADAARKAELEKSYGRKAMKSLVEDCLSDSWISSNSKNCPHCQSVIEKTEGCNKMTCFRCGSYFCWLCLKLLKMSNPYLHYQDRSSQCYDQLFPEEYLDDAFEIEPGEFLNL
ncbi:E3 ubiquitin-protein ligase RNF14-like [Uloborus diversus]|uniref:E3 ubiquitin-protein ligase RNF14-like n=1 Tax=Uloborus diversus TaxID=327109 RepID=UPI0024092207|nr:E3 ubiquitin-protein ligase RNF14-like [Uloborus diversus]